MLYEGNGRLRGGPYVTPSESLGRNMLKQTKPRKKTTKKTPMLQLQHGVNSKDLQRPGAPERGHRRSQRQRNRVGPMQDRVETTTVAAATSTAAARCLFCLPDTRAVPVYPASLRKGGSQVVERNRSSSSSSISGSKGAVYPQNQPKYNTPNEVILNWKAYPQQLPSPSSSSYRPRTEVAQTSSSSSLWSQQPRLMQSSTNHVPPSSTSSSSTPTNTPTSATTTTTTTLRDVVSFPRYINGSYIATLLPGLFLDRSSTTSSSLPHPAPGIPGEEQHLVPSSSSDQGMSSAVVIGLAIGCVLAFWLIIGPIVCVVMKRSFRTSQTKLFQRQDCSSRTGSGKGGGRAVQGSTRLLEEMEISALQEKTPPRLYHHQQHHHHHRTPEYPDDGHRFPVVYAPVPQAPPSPPLQVRRDFCPPGYDAAGYVSTAVAANDPDRNNSSESSTRTYETLSVDGTTAASIGFCVCGRERFCLSSGSVRTPVISSCNPVVQSGRWRPLPTRNNPDYDGGGWYSEDGYGQQQHQLTHAVTSYAKVDSADDMIQPNYPAIGSAGTSRKFPKMGQTCLRNSYAASRGSRTRVAHGGGGAHDGLQDWSTEDCSRPCPEGRARSEDRMDDEVLINRCVRTPVGYRRLARAGSVSPRVVKARKQASLDAATCLA